MKRLILAATAVVALLSGVSSANATQFVMWGPVDVDGSFTGVFGNDGVPGDVNGLFSDTFNFALPTGVSSFTATSTFTNDPANDINFTSIRFNGINFGIGSTGQNEFRFLNGVSVASGAPQQLIVAGTTGGTASYSGVISFNAAAAAVPEPAAWALMILGFGGTGAMLRRRQKVAIAAA